MAPTYRIFISSPSDVGRERQITERVLARVEGRLGGRIKIVGYFWEHEPLRATVGDFQQNIELPENFDLVLCILWSRIGTRLHPGKHRRRDGSEYSSGTEFEFENAMAAYELKKAPELLVYRRRTHPVITPEPQEEHDRQMAQWAALKRFCEQWFKDESVGCFKAAYNSYKDAEEFETKLAMHLERLVRDWLLQQAGQAHGGARAAAQAVWTHESPYRGLQRFEMEHEPIFYGRTRARDEVLGSLHARQQEEKCPFVIILGASGSGKSSLLRAGVMPWLIKPGVVEGIGLWRHATFCPGENTGGLLAGLAQALVESKAMPELLADGTTVEELARQLAETPEMVAPLAKGALSQAAAEDKRKHNLTLQPQARLAVGLDQLEEMFTLEDRFTREDRVLFVRALDALARSGFAWIVATLRSDFYNRCEELPQLVELKKGKGQYHLLPPTSAELGRMIRNPAEDAGLEFEADDDKGRLDEVIRDEALRQVGPLPLLEHVLDQIYLLARAEGETRLRFRHYERLEGIAGALNRKAEDCFAGFLRKHPGGEEVFGRVFGRLVTVGSGADAPSVRRWALREDVARHAMSGELVARFVADRLFVSDRSDQNGVVVSLAHEALLVGWTRLRDWIQRHRRMLQHRAEIADDTRRWLENGRSADYLRTGAVPLERARALLKDEMLGAEEKEFVTASLEAAAAQELREALAAGERLAETNGKVAAEFPEVQRRVLEGAARSSVSAIRRRTATLLGEGGCGALVPELKRLLESDGEPEVRAAAAAAIVQLDDARLMETEGPESERSQAHLRVAADHWPRAGAFETSWDRLRRPERIRILIRAWGQRLRQGLPTLLLVMIPTVTLSSVMAAVFKFFPGMANYAICQAVASGVAGIFHAITASFLWGGMITCAVVLHRIVFFAERGPKSTFRPAGAWVAGVIGGLISSYLVLCVITYVCEPTTVYNLAWTDVVKRAESNGNFWDDILWRTRFYWAYLILGTGLGVGMAATANSLLGSKDWARFWSEQGAIKEARQIFVLVANLSRRLVRHAWPIPVAMILAWTVAFGVLRRAPARVESQSAGWVAGLTGGVQHEGHDAAAVRLWKRSAWGQGLGLFWDAATQGFGGFFCIVGMGVGLVVARHGVRIEPRKT